MPEALEVGGWEDSDKHAVGKMLRMVLKGLSSMGVGVRGWLGWVEGVDGIGAEGGGGWMNVVGLVRALREGRETMEELGLGVEGDALWLLGEEKL